MRTAKWLVNGLGNVLLGLTGVCAVFLAGCILTGCTPYIVLSGSMEPNIKTGSLCVVDTKAAFHEIKTGDVIAFETGSGSLVTHRAVAFRDGIIETKGDANAVTDGLTTSEANFRGRTICSIPYLGYVLSWLRTGRGKVLAVTGVATLALLSLWFDEKEKERKLIEGTNR